MSLPNLTGSECSDEETSSQSDYADYGNETAGDSRPSTAIEDPGVLHAEGVARGVQTQKPKTTVIQRALEASRRVDKLLKKLKKEDVDEAALENEVSSRINLLKTIRLRIRRDAENDVEIDEEEYAKWRMHKDFEKRLNVQTLYKSSALAKQSGISVDGPGDKAVQATSSERLKVSLSNFLPKEAFEVSEAEYRAWCRKNNYLRYLEPRKKTTVHLTKSKSLTDLASLSEDSLFKSKPPVASPSHIKFVKELDSVIFDAEYQLLQSRKSRLLKDSESTAESQVEQKKASWFQTLNFWFWAIVMNDWFWSVTILIVMFIYYYWL